MSGITSSTTAFTLPPKFRRSQLPIYHHSIPTVRFNLSTVRIQATSPTVDVSKTIREGVSENKEIKTSSSSTILGCPICYDPLTWSNDSISSLESVRGTTLQCSSCKKVYNGNDFHFDLTAASGSKDYVESMAPVTEFFRTPAMSYVYERGWRQNFGIGGYPGPDKEFEMAKEYLGPVLGGNVIDASCGSGVFSRLFAKSGLFSLVIALDFSESMLRQCYEFVKKDQDFPKDKLVLVRADISRLPFVSHSIDAVHAGAALHCWPSPSAAVSITSYFPVIFTFVCSLLR